MRAGVIGSGIAGIAMAQALRRAGFAVDLLERSPECRSTGYQLNVLANGNYALGRIGLLDALKSSGVGAPMLAAPIVDGLTGRTLREIPVRGVGTEYAPRSFHRGDLHRALLDGLEGPPPECSREVVLIVDAPDADVAVHFQGGEVRTFDFVVGADGAHSTVRQQLFPTHGGYQPKFAGLLFAADIDLDGRDEAERLLARQIERGEFVQIGAPGAAVVLSGAGAGRFGVIVASVVPGFEAEVTDPESAKAVARSLTRRIRDPRVPHVIEHGYWEAGNPLLWRVGDIEPLPRFHEGRITLAGDAAHAMIPVVGQGANQSFEDAMVLASRLEEATRSSSDGRAAIGLAFERYSAERAPHVAVIQREARRRLAAMGTTSALGYRFGNWVLRWLPQRVFDRFDDHILKYAIEDPACPIG